LGDKTSLSYLPQASWLRDDTRRPSLAVLRKQNGAPMGDKTNLSCLRSKLAQGVGTLSREGSQTATISTSSRLEMTNLE